MTITWADIARNAALDAITALVNVSGAGDVRIVSGAAVQLALIPLPADAYGNASAGSSAMSGLPVSDTTADATGTAATYQVRDGADTVVFDGVTTTGGDGAVNLSAAAQRAALDAMLALANGGDIQFTTAGDTGFASVVATVPLNATAFNAASGSNPATATLNTTVAVAANASPGSASACTLFRIRRSAGNGAGEVARGTVGTSGADINFNSNVFPAGINVSVPTLNASQAQQAATTGEMVLGTLSITAGQAVTITAGSLSYPAS